MADKCKMSPMSDDYDTGQEYIKLKMETNTQ